MKEVEIEKLIEMGESSTLEFKRLLPSEDKKVLKTFVAFANGAGGKVIFGVEDSTGKVLGVPDEGRARLQDSITDMISDSCSPQLLPIFTWLSVSDKALLVVEIAASPNCPYFIKSEGVEKGTYIRVGATTRRAEQNKIRELEIYGSRRTYDEIVEHAVEAATADEIGKLCSIIQEYRSDATKPVGIEQLLSWRLLVQSRKELLPSVLSS